MDLELLNKRIQERHQDDLQQLEVIFSEANRLLVEAPAGYGKTQTLVSKIAYLIATKQIPFPKRLLALTFSVNAAYKIKKDVMEQVPKLLVGTEHDVKIREKISVTNYHGFCRIVLRKYGSALDPNFVRFDEFTNFDDSKPDDINYAVPGLLGTEVSRLVSFATAVKAKDVSYIRDNINSYCDLISEKFLPQNYISFNAILTFTIRLFEEKGDVKRFYNEYYGTLIVDEFQDTNWLSLWLLTCLINDKTKVILLGDSLQRIYGFIGAVPNALDKARRKFGLETISLSKNYRFASNEQMLRLDSNIRRNAENTSAPEIESEALIDLTVLPNQDEEANHVKDLALQLTKDNLDAKVAILVKQRGQNLDAIINVFRQSSIPFFYGVFTDDDLVYSRFHSACSVELNSLITQRGQLRKSLGIEHLKRIEEQYEKSVDPIVESCLLLLKTFWERLFLETQSLAEDERITYIRDVFSNNGLKQYVQFVGIDIVISTVHAAKGLEWDFVILPDMEKDLFPNWFGLCKECLHGQHCKISVTKSNEDRFLEELSVFYVAVTRAKKQVSFSASSLDVNGRVKNVSCFLSLPGIKSLGPTS